MATVRARAMYAQFRAGHLTGDELREAVEVVWTDGTSPLAMLNKDRWREMLGAVFPDGVIAEPVTLYRGVVLHDPSGSTAVRQRLYTGKQNGRQQERQPRRRGMGWSWTSKIYLARAYATVMGGSAGRAGAVGGLFMCVAPPEAVLGRFSRDGDEFIIDTSLLPEPPELVEEYRGADQGSKFVQTQIGEAIARGMRG